jgi:Flp pilus assembly protein TadD
MKYLLAILITFTLITSYSGDSAPPVKNDPLWLIEVRASIKSGNYEKAIQQLQNSNQITSADWNNLMGYSLRQQNTPDLIGAESFYQAALNIDSKHKGALEYYGMLRLIKNDLAGAEELLAKLDKICFFGCEEYSDLKDAIKKYKTKK